MPPSGSPGEQKEYDTHHAHIHTQKGRWVDSGEGKTGGNGKNNGRYAQDHDTNILQDTSAFSLFNILPFNTSNIVYEIRILCF